MSAGAITLLVDDPGWRKTRGLVTRLRRAAEAAVLGSGFKGKSGLTVLLGSDEKLRQLNREFRGKNKPTNVLSFPAPSNPGGYRGDIAIAYGVTRKEADESGKRLADHASHLVVHGVLHLAGYDHTRSRDAKIMEPLEIKILKRLGVADPYGASDRKSAQRSVAVAYAAARQLRPAVRPKNKVSA